VSQIQTKFLANNAVTNAKLAQAPANTLKGNNTGSTANVTDLTVSQVNTMLGLSTTYATVTLNNLTTTAINADLLPASNGTINIGSTSLLFNKILANGLYSSGNIKVVDPQNLILNDTAGNESIGWSARQLVNTGAIIDWATSNTLKFPQLATIGVLTINGSGVVATTPYATAFNLIAPATAKGGVIVGSGTNTYGNVAVGSDNSLLMADSSSTNGAAYLRPSNLKNYISNPGFESNTTTGWSLGTTGTLTNNIPTGSPTFGSGASGNLSITTVSSGQLAGSYSLSYACSANSTSGNMVSSAAFTLDAEDQAKVMTFKFYYSAFSGSGNLNFSGTSSNSLGIAVYDVTNSVWLSSTANFGMTQSSGVGYVTGTCQTGSSTASVRFVIYNANSSSGAFTMYFDDFYFGPQTAPLGAVMIDAVAYTPTISNAFGTVTNSQFWYERRGDKMLITGSFTSGTLTGNNATITLPSGFTTDTTKLPSSANANSPVGFWSNSNGSANTIKSGPMLVAGSASTITFTAGDYTSSNNGLNTQAGTSLGATGNAFSVWAEIPITGWSSNVQSSSDTDTRVVAFAAVSVTATVTSSYSDLSWTTVNNDTHGAYSSPTYTIPVTGYYDFSGQVFVSATTIAAGNNFTIGILNSTSSTTLRETEYVYEGTNTTNQAIQFNYKSILLNAGTAIKMQIKSNTTSPVITASSTENFWSISRISGPSVIAATESVNARYFSSTTTITSSLANITYATKDFDSHNAMSGATYTIPVSGKYQVNASILMTATTTAANNLIQLQINKNGSAYSGPNELYFTSSTSKPMTLVLADIINCSAGDTITVQASNAGTTPSISSSNSANYFSISRAGN